MEISSKMATTNYMLKAEQSLKKVPDSKIKSFFSEKLTSDELKEIKAQIEQSAKAYIFNSINIQNSAQELNDRFENEYQEFQNFLSDIGYEGKPIAELSQEEAAELVSEDGFFGVTKTSQRIADFVINGAGGDEGLLRAGREGVLAGFKMAEEMWGGELPEISQTTMGKTIELIDMAMSELGFSIINKEV